MSLTRTRPLRVADVSRFLARARRHKVDDGGEIKFGDLLHTPRPIPRVGTSELQAFRGVSRVDRGRLRHTDVTMRHLEVGTLCGGERK